MKRVLLLLVVVNLAVRLIYVPHKLGTPVLSNVPLHHLKAIGKAPVSNETASEKLFDYYNFAEQTTSRLEAAAHGERLLILIPLRDAEPVMEMMFNHLGNLTYPHHLIDLAFLVSDSQDGTYEKLIKRARSIQKDVPELRFNSVDIFKRDFGAIVGQGFDDRHGINVQAERRKLMGRARNQLLLSALKPYHSWVYWRDADIESSLPTIIQDMMQHNRDVLVPNVWRPLPSWLGHQQPYDLNSRQESEVALELASRMDVDDVIVEGYAELFTYRVYLAFLRNPEGGGDQSEILDLDGIGGVSILAKAHAFRAGANFPGFALWNHAETEAFGKMCHTMGFSVAGLTQYTVWHKYEPSQQDLEIMQARVEQGLDPY